MREVRHRIELVDRGIKEVNTRCAMTGALVLEVSRERGRDKAEALAARMSGLPESRGYVRVSRLEKAAYLQVRDLEVSVSGRRWLRPSPSGTAAELRPSMWTNLGRLAAV